MNRSHFCLLMLLASLGVQAASPPVQEYTLDNGLKILIQEDHRAPVVVSQVWYRVGSSYEHDGITGVSHALEHMMFKGTEKHPPGEFSRIIAANGGQENAFTSADYTAYFQTMEKSRLPVSFELEADRMRHLKLTEDEFTKEIKVVAEERRLRTEDQPQSLAYEVASATAYQTSPYRQPVIGWMADIEHMTVTDLQSWYQHWYAPNNATVVVVGDVKPEEVYALAKQNFNDLPKETIAPEKRRPEVEQLGMKRVTVKATAELPYLMMAYKTPTLATALRNKQVPESEIFALEVLSSILDGGDSARLNQRLVRGSQIASSASAGYDTIARLESLFILSAVPAPGHKVVELETALKKELKDLQEKLVEPQELQRVKNRVIADNIYQRDSIFYQAMQIGMLDSVGLDWRLKDTYVDSVKAVTAEQVREVARKYFIDDHLTVAVLDPIARTAATSLAPSVH